MGARRMTGGTVAHGAMSDVESLRTTLTAVATDDRWRRPRVAFQGAPGAFSDIAIAEVWNGHATSVPYADFGAALRAIADGEAEYALIPLDNSAIGRIEASHAAVEWHGRMRGDIVVLGYSTHAVRHCLVALAGATLASIRRVASHPAALAQCARFAAEHPAMTCVPAYDTAGAAAAIARRGTLLDAAIAPRAAAARYGLVVLAEDIQDDPHNATRFGVFARRRSPATAACDDDV